MRLLLTSSGLLNSELQKEFIELLGMSPTKAKAAFVVTASNKQNDKDYVQVELGSLRQTGVSQIQTVDIAEPREKWLHQIQEAEVWWFVGGNVGLLLRGARRSGFDKAAIELAPTKLYVGCSAGGKFATPDGMLLTSHPDPEISGGLGLVDFCVIPHMNNPHFPERTPDQIGPKLKGYPGTVYLIDEGSAVRVVDDKVSVVGGGVYVEYTP